MGTTHVSQLSAPDVNNMRPSGRVVTVGYHRGYAIGRVIAHVPVAPSKMLPSTSPTPAFKCPPAMNPRPSARKACPTQNMFVTVFGADVNPPVAGFQRVAVCPPSS